MVILICKTHQVKFIPVEKRFETPQGSLARFPPCKMFTMKEIKPGRYGECEIVKEE